MSRHTRLLASITVFAASLLIAAEAAAQIVQTPSGPLEFIGLRRWNAQQLWDSIYALAPGEGAHACASTFTMVFGFADAHVIVVRETNEETGDEQLHWVATVVEDSALVSWFELPPARAVGAEAAHIYTALRRSELLDQAIVPSYIALLAQGRDSAQRLVRGFNESLLEWGRSDTVGEEVEQMWDTLGAHRTPADLSWALRTLTTDGNDTNRIVALLLLTNFSDRDEAWHAVVRELGVPGNDRRRWLGLGVLTSFTRELVRPVDWSTMTGYLRPLLSGTSVGSINGVMKALVATRIDTAYGRTLLSKNTWLLSALLSAKSVEARQPAIGFLRYLRGHLDADRNAAAPGNVAPVDPELLAWLKGFE